MTLLGPVVLASANPHKVEEIRQILADVKFVARPDGVPDVAETESTFEGNARLKAQALCEATGMAALADDSGIEVDALGGAPGVYSARFAGEHATDEENLAKLERDMVGKAERGARYRCVIVLARPDGTETVADGTVEGTLLDERRGGNGFGYDPVFVPSEGGGRTFAEMTATEKHAISHRGRALRVLSQMIGS